MPLINVVAQMVSIHAPVWGATLSSGLCKRFSSVSIHAPVWGATPFCKTKTPPFYCFNPRSRMGSDGFEPDTVVGIKVSIHAPVWGATLCLGAKQSRRRSFNPRSRMGSDVRDVELRHTQQGFNPRSRMGSDQVVFLDKPPELVSIHAPVWGATRKS